MRFGLGRLFLYVQRLSLFVELHHPVALGVTHAIRKHRGSRAVSGGRTQLLRKTVAVKDVVTQKEGHAVLAYKAAPDDECLRQALRPELLGVSEGNPPLMAVSEETPVQGQVPGCGN